MHIPSPDNLDIAQQWMNKLGIKGRERALAANLFIESRQSFLLRIRSDDMIIT